MRLLDDFQLRLLSKVTEGLSRRFEVVSQNLANANTPGYKRRELLFEEELRSLLQPPRRLPLNTTDPRHIANLPRSLSEVIPLVRTDASDSYRNDLNNVDPEVEMAKLLEARLQYQAAMRFAAKRSSMIRAVMTGGRS